jgi:hypothetical protein
MKPRFLLHKVKTIASMKKVILLGSAVNIQEYEIELQKLKNIDLLGFLDPDDTSTEDILDRFLTVMNVIEKGDVFIFTRDVKNVDFEVIRQMIRMGKHVFIDGYRIWSTGELEEIEKLRFESQTIFHFGNHLCGLPITVAAMPLVHKPRFIRVEKHSVSPELGCFDSWIFENLSEEINLVQKLMKSMIRNISAKPIFLFGEKPDLVTIYIEFHNDGVCQLSVGQALEKGTHRILVYQKETLIEVDIMNHTLTESKNTIQTDQLSLDFDINIIQDQEISQNLVPLERHIAPLNSKKLALQHFFDSITRHSSQPSHLSHLIDVTDMVEVICEKVKRRYSTL